ncbi:hydroxymethylbilane synthase [Methanococcoides methylutens]|uniref:Probable porphobilinogen deaminase n=1 Tax=Methanococcoides methylutens MM1 TaxID=1434104 RepID=A0A0E3SRT9_METMT|nr:hydroxymethylbilane synthase [Methanococcoides methylutens]AKB85731.1 Porphobilinogen deaminase [Methanococcoides methylutens MM1]
MILGTRGSALAVAQADLVTKMLEERGHELEREIIKTSGDVFTDRPLHEVAGVGAFVRELDDRMIAGEVDIAVHSMKDLPTIRPPELAIAAVLERDSPYDVLLTQDGSTLDELPDGAIIGTTSMRRRAQLLRFRPDLNIQDLRGNINTRIKKLEDGLYDGILLAEAGLQRMGWEMNVHRLPPEGFCPSANQGTIVVVTRAGSEAEKICSELNHEQSRIETEVERILITDVEGGCVVPIGSFARVTEDGDEIHVLVEVLSLDGTREVRIDEMIPMKNYREHAASIGRMLVEMGGKELVRDAVCELSGCDDE